MAATERRNEGIESGSESAEVKFLDKHNASGDSRGEYGYGLRLASQPASHRGTCFSTLPPFLLLFLLLLWPSILFLLLSSLPSHPLSLMCVKEKDVCRGMCAHQRDFTVLLQRDCIRVHARASVSRMRMCWRGKEEGEVEQELGGMEVSEARCTDHDRFSFVKCHAE